MWLGSLAILFIIPFTISNFISGHVQVALASTLVIITFAFNTVTVLFYKTYHSMVSLLVLCPAILIFCGLSIPNQGIIGVLWCFPALVCLYYLLSEKLAWAANLVILTWCAYLVLTHFEPGLAYRMIATLSLVSVFTAVSIRHINKQQVELQRLAITDSLTGLFNRNIIKRLLNDLIRHQGQIESHLMTLDVDHFKRINDSFGHDQGDDVLKQIAHCIQNQVGEHGVVFRHGGEEFMAVIEDMPLSAAKSLAEDIRKRVALLQINGNHQVTLSIGLAPFQKNMTRIDWIRASDRNLYLAKNQGRNRVEVTND